MSLTLLLFLINRLRHRKSRHRNIRQQSDDQRSIGSIGYLSGNYMGGPSDMGFGYDANPAHYPPWKLSGQYFPRGEAPPPYEEAIALAQAESLSACTVSVATTHRTLPLNVCNTEAEMSNITANLINININNAGNITAVATGENHILSSSFGRSPANTLSRQSDLVSVNPASDTPVYPCNVPQVIALPAREIPCTLQNCELNTNTITSSFCNLSNGRSPSCSLRQLPKEVQTSNQSIATVSNNVPSNQVVLDRITSMNSTSGSVGNSASNVMMMEQRTHSVSNAILPPPLFGERSNSRETLLAVVPNNNNHSMGGTTPNETPKTPSSKRYHRTIPRHLSGVDAIIPSPTNNNHSQSLNPSGGGGSQSEGQSPGGKKASCQCPVQHVPCSYMGSQLNSSQQPPNNLFLSTLTTKLNNVAAKQAVKQQQPSMSPKIQTISGKQDNSPATVFTSQSGGYEPTPSSSSHSLRRMKPSLLKLEAAHPNSALMQTPNKKIHTVVSKQSSSGDHKVETVLLHQEPKPILKSKSGNGGFMDHTKDDPLMSAYPMTMIETVSKKVEPNPVLPPKLYKSGKHGAGGHTPRHDSYYSNSKIHTITRPSETAQFSILNDRNSAQMSSLRFRHKPQNGLSTSLPRTESAHSGVDRLTTFGHPVTSSSVSGKPPSGSHCQSTMVVQYGNNTLPKNGKHGPASSRISDVVNKVPSVITLPHPQSAVATSSCTLRSSASSLSSIDAAVAAATNMMMTQHVPSSAHHSQHNSKSHSPATTPKTPTTPTSHHSMHDQQSHHYGGEVNHGAGGAYYSSSSSKMSSLSSGQATMVAGATGKSLATSSSSTDKPLPVLTTSTNCTNPKQHFLPNDTSLDDEYLSECENCKTAHGSRYYLDEEEVEETRETMTLQRKMMPETESEEQLQNYYRVSSTLPTNTSKKPP